MDKNEIKKLIEASLNKQEESIKTFIGGHTTLIHQDLSKINTRLETIFKRLDSMEIRVTSNEETIKDIEKSLQFTQGLVDDKIREISEECEKRMKKNEDGIKAELLLAKKNENIFKDKLRVLEDRGRRNNLKIDGIKESEKETWEECEEKIQEVLEKKLNISGIEIERAHRMGRKQSGSVKPRTIIFKLFNWKQKELILKNTKYLKDTGIYINEDFSDATIEIRKKLLTEMKEHRSKGKFSVIIYDKLVTRDFKHKC